MFKRTCFYFTLILYFFKLPLLYSNIIYSEYLEKSSDLFYKNKFSECINLLNKNFHKLYAKEKLLLALAYKKNNQLEKSKKLLFDIEKKVKILRPIVHYHIAEILQQEKKYQNANEYFLKVSKSKFKNLNQVALFNLVSNYKVLNDLPKTEKYLKILKKKYVTDFSYYNDVFLDIPVKPDILLELAKLYFNNKKYKKSFNSLKKIIKKYPSSTSAYYAVKLFEENTNIFKTSKIKFKDDFLFEVYKVKFNKGQFRSVIPYLKKLLSKKIKHKQKKDIPEIRYYLGRSYYKLRGIQNQNAAKQQFNMIIKYYRNSIYAPKALFYNGIIAERNNDWKTTLKNMRQIIKNYKNYYYSYAAFKEILDYYEIFKQTKNFELSLKKMTQFFLRKKQSDYAEQAYWKTILFFYKNNNYKSAIKNLISLKKTTPDNSSEHIKINFWLFKCYTKINDQKNADIFLKKNLKFKQADSYYFWRTINFCDKINATKFDSEIISNLESSNKIEITKKLKSLKIKNSLFKFLIAIKDYDDLKLLLEKEKSNRTLKLYISYLTDDFIETIHQSTLLEIKNKNLKNKFIKFKYPLAYFELVKKNADLFSFNNYLPISIMREESRFSKKCISSAGAIGLMQIMPGTGRTIAQRIAFKNFDSNMLFKPEINVKFGVNELKHLFENWEKNNEKKDISNLIFSIGSYNAGYTAVTRWFNSIYKPNNFDIDYFVENIPYKETKNYVRRVYRSCNIYKLLLKIKKK
jgi:soluble lytic murein transglycosylase